jgi:hypothetical protein
MKRVPVFIFGRVNDIFGVTDILRALSLQEGEESIQNDIQALHLTGLSCKRKNWRLSDVA